MLVHEKSKLELCADTVRAADKHRFLDSRCVKLKQAAEAADIGAHAGCHCSCNV